MKAAPAPEPQHGDKDHTGVRGYLEREAEGPDPQGSRDGRKRQTGTHPADLKKSSRGLSRTAHVPGDGLT